MTDRKQMTPLAVLRAFFGYRKGQGLKDFSTELNQLSAEEKAEMAQLAAGEMDVDLVETKK